MAVIKTVIYVLLAISTLNRFSWSTTTTECVLKDKNFGTVCLCTAEHCDYLENPEPVNEKDFVIVSSSKNGLRFKTTNGTFETKQEIVISETTRTQESILVSKTERDFSSATILTFDGKAFLQFGNGANSPIYQTPLANIVHLRVNREKKYQRIEGFGGAFTGAVSHILKQLDVELQDHIYKSFFHKDGIAFNTVRMSIGGCDFDLEPWAYNELPQNDAQLTNFTRLDQRDEQKIDQLKRLQTVAKMEKLKIMAAAWSPPIWMKTNGDWTGFSQLKTEFYQTWANYHLKFLELMDAKNMPIWAISTGNEPLNGIIGWFFVRFMSLGWTPRNQAIWLSENLGPTIRNSKYKQVLIFGNDDQRYTYPGWFNSMKLSRTNSLDYLDGLAVHWYWDDVLDPNLIDSAHKSMPNKLLFSTEACVGDKPWQTHGPELGSWDRAEKYVRSFLQDLQHAFNGWIDWNIILNEQGGPNYVQNHVDAPVIVNTTSGKEFYKQPMFYAMGHFSKFIPEGSIRIDTQLLNINVDAVGFMRPDGKIIVVVFNGGSVPADLVLNDSIRGSVAINIPPRSLHTVIYN